VAAGGGKKNVSASEVGQDHGITVELLGETRASQNSLEKLQSLKATSA